MSNIILLAETGADIPVELIHKYNLAIVPMHVQFGDITKDDASFPAEEVVTYYETTGNLPKTSGSTPGDFIQILDQIHTEHPDAHILYMAYSSVTTCSYSSCQIAAENRDYVTMIDTKQVSAGQCAAVIETAKWLKAHPEASIQEAAAKAEEISRNVSMCFIPDTLKFLQAGGRVSNGTALVGSILKIHPVIQIIDGYLQATKKVRGKMNQLIPKLVDDFIKQENLRTDEIIFITTPRLSKENMNAAEQAAAKLDIKKVTWIPTGGVITCHGGPGAFGIVGFKNE